MRYRRADAAGGIFFTVNLAERRTDVLVRHIGYIHFNPVKHGWVTPLLIGHIQHCMARLSGEWQHRIGVEKWVIE
ncbi:MAG: hypothetical protein ABL869_12165 [Candidatus Nitrotoga sp.]